ncbi:hypothetical protein [Hansschlegelia sp. KR7-227]|uniref:hypothetical protein n=1 Tax=Hansschlegelia sp. KR7-227 TaxID=3400914 RepID=UPI003C054E8E
MSNRLELFRNEVAAAEAEDAAARADLLSELKAMTLMQFTDIPQATLESLTHNQYVEVLRSLVFNFEMIDDSVGDLDVELRKPRRLSWLWSLAPTQMRAVLKGVGLGLLVGWFMLLAGLQITSWVDPQAAPPSITEWPRCPHFDATVDACVYRVAAPISWAGAATLLKITEWRLRYANGDPEGPMIPVGTDIAIWRGNALLLLETRP